MGKKRIPEAVGVAALADLSTQLGTAVRYLLQRIETEFPGGTIELRVPPFGAIQCVEGMDHRRGTPPNVVELDPEVFIELALGKRKLDLSTASPDIRLSGVRASAIAKVFDALNP